MKKNRSRSVLLIAACVALVMARPVTSHALITGSYVDNLNGTYTYSYTIDNSAGSFDIVAFSLEFGFSSALIDWDQFDSFSGGDVAVPNSDWFAFAGIPTVGLSSQDFLLLNPASDVLIGAVLSGFSFTSALTPGNVNFYVEFGATGESESGFTVGPTFMAASNVPDAGSGLTLGFIALSFGLMASRCVKRDRPSGSVVP